MMFWWHRPRYAQAPADAAGTGSGTDTAAKQAQGADSGAGATPPAGAAGAADSKQDGGGQEQKSMLSGSGAGEGDGSQAGKGTQQQGDKDAGGQKATDPVKVTLPDKLPDGVAVDKDFVSAFEAQAQAVGLDSDEASGLVTWYLEQEGQRIAKVAQDLKQWSDEQYDLLKNDSEFGGKNFDESRAAVQKALQRFGKPYGLVERLEALHLDNDPAIIKTLAAIGRAISEDKATVDQATGSVVSSEERELRTRYPSHYKQQSA